MDFQKQKPIYLQIADSLTDQMLQGSPTEGERMPSVREVAAQLGVNPNTVMRTFEHLQREEIIFNRRGVGYFVADDAKKKILDIMHHEFITDELPSLCHKMQLLGIGIDEIQTALNQYPALPNAPNPTL